MSVAHFASGSDWPVKPSLGGLGVEVAFSGTRSAGPRQRAVAYSLGEAPSVVSEVYSEVFQMPREIGEATFANLVGAPDFDTAAAAFKEAEAAPTPYDAAHAALGGLIAHNYRFSG